MQRFLNQLKKDNSLLYNKLKRVDYSNHINVLNYLDENFDLYVYQSEDDFIYKKYRIGFKVPDFEITNSKGYNTKITDFIIMPFKITNNKLIADHSYLRETWDYKQNNMNYVHSHVNTMFGIMCLGSSDHLKSAFYEFDDVDTIHYNITQFIEALKWESVEGGPYKKISANDNINLEIDDIEIDPDSVSYDNKEIKITLDDSRYRSSEFKVQRFPNNQYKDRIYYKNGHKKHIKTLAKYEVQTFDSIKKQLTEKYYGEAITERIKADREQHVLTNS